MLDSFFAPLLELLAMPSVGLGAIFVVSALAATILPLGSEPIFLGYLALQPELFWAAVLVATAGNSLGGFITYWMGAGAHLAFKRWRRPRLDGTQAWVHRFGAPILLLSWLPVVGDPLCAVAGWMRLPWLPCLIFIMIGKFARYLVLGGAMRLLLL